LLVLNDQRPTLILGFVLREFLTARAKAAKRPCAEGEMYCMRCRTPQKPLGMMVDYVPISSSQGRLVALCAVCECVCASIASAASLPQLSQIWDIATNTNQHD